ncbi:hypothetical protein [Epilithonimonas xixisoli]|nr:hypothetical protein [Epilithonimonas xixisoli]
MAKVGTERITHKGSGKEFFVTINFYTKTKLFTAVDFPEEIKDWYGAKLTREQPSYASIMYQGNITGKSYDECKNLAIKVFSEYYDQCITEERIIAYKIKSNSKETSDISFAPNTALGLEFHVLWRIKIGDETFISPANYEASKRPESGIRLGGPQMTREDGRQGYYDYQKIPYTEETHNFFINVVTGLEAMIIKVNEFFGKDSNHFIDNLSKGKLLN